MKVVASGRVNRMSKLPRDMSSDWRIDSSAIRPSTKASTSGAASKPNFFMR